MASENALPCYDRDSYNKILESAKPLNDPDGRHLSSFTFLRLSPVLMQNHNLLEFERFVKQMHGKHSNFFILYLENFYKQTSIFSGSLNHSNSDDSFSKEVSYAPVGCLICIMHHGRSCFDPKNKILCCMCLIS